MCISDEIKLVILSTNSLSSTFPPCLTSTLSPPLWAQGSGTEQQVRASAGAGEEEEGAE